MAVAPLLINSLRIDRKQLSKMDKDWDPVMQQQSSKTNKNVDGEEFRVMENDVPKSFKRLMHTMNYSKNKANADKTTPLDSKSNNKSKNASESPRKQQEPQLKIRPDESLREFSERVERESASRVASAVKSSQGDTETGSGNRKKEKLKERKRAHVEKQKMKQQQADDEEEAKKRIDQVKFGEVVQAPPTGLKVPKRVQKAVVKNVASSGVGEKSLYEQQALAIERDRVIQLYRSLKKKQQNQGH